MGCLTKCMKAILVGILGILKTGLAIAIIVIIAVQLQDWVWTENNTNLTINCLISGSVSSSSTCDYMYAVCGISMCVSFCLAIFLCITCDCCGCGSWIEAIVSACQTAWWCIAAAIVSKRVSDTNDLSDPSWPQANWRTSIAVMSWVSALLCFLCFLIYIIDAFSSCCGGRKEKKEKKSKDVEAAPPPPQKMGKDEPVKANAV
ncbi:hypothetical protein HYH03_000239 [Edaphochlamys debaryana]|uniref:Uncharacterized protein n=1 Tax=Edaphochlamys debaryana TaxID=47281 RepID=A0A835YQ04_9CHLO|nr:hypothetical protein HYH03_000239 [Edaphochlamys debaryana]|eukprot:KAG2501739.1 hypothetical protein HYH03_000239 [Edaphochlamys debaryana]